VKSIFLPVTPQSMAVAPLLAAAKLAREFDATLTTLLIQDDPRAVVPFLGEGLTVDMMQGMYEAAESEIKEQAVRAHQIFLTAMEFADMPVGITRDKRPQGANARWLVVQGSVADYVGKRARTADVAICLKPDPATSDTVEIFNDLIYRSGRPVFMVPAADPKSLDQSWEPNFQGMDFLIAWNGSAECARAVAAAKAFMPSDRPVSITQIDPTKAGRPGLSDLALYLSEHSIDTREVRAELESQSVGAQILAVAEAERSHLIVAGAYSHSRWREMILGGVTKHLVTHSTLPVFFCH